MLPPETIFMSYFPILILITLVLAGVAGCTQSGAPAPVHADNQTLPDTQGGNVSVSGSPTPLTTINRALLPMVPYKDTRLRIAFYAPEDWIVTTRQVLS